MNKALFLAAALMAAPLPVLAQQAGNASGVQPQTAQNTQPGGQSFNAQEDTYGIEGGYGEEGGPAKRGDLLDRLAQSDLRDRIASGIESVEAACGPDIERYCGQISPGGGRIALCMRAYADQLSRRCRFTLFRVSRNLRQTVENIADECWNGIKQQCGNTDKIGECAVQKSASLSPTCQSVVAVIHEAGQKLAQLKNMPVYSADGTDLGRVVEVQRTPDGKLQSVQIQIGRFLGLGDKVVTIDGDKIQQMADRLRLQLNGDQVRNMPEAKKQGF
jgi:sporulation protein YlmC with PRC-barrel domain